MRFRRIQDYHTYVRKRVASCQRSTDWVAVQLQDAKRKSGLIVANPLRFKDGSILRVLEEIQIQDDGTILRPKYSYHYERTRDGRGSTDAADWQWRGGHREHGHDVAGGRRTAVLEGDPVLECEGGTGRAQVPALELTPALLEGWEPGLFTKCHQASEKPVGVLARPDPEHAHLAGVVVH